MKIDKSKITESFSVDGKFISLAYNAACRQWQKNIEEKFPALFKSDFDDLDKGSWYYNMETGEVFCAVTPTVNDNGAVRFAVGLSGDHRFTAGMNLFKMPENPRRLQKLEPDPNIFIGNKFKVAARKLGYIYENTISNQDRKCHSNTDKNTFENKDWTFVNGMVYTAPPGAGGKCIFDGLDFQQKLKTKEVTQKEFEEVFGTNAIYKG